MNRFDTHQFLTVEWTETDLGEILVRRRETMKIVVHVCSTMNQVKTFRAGTCR